MHKLRVVFLIFVNTRFNIILNIFNIIDLHLDITKESAIII
jgi:hypothetical protein